MDDFQILRKEFLGKWEYLKKKIAYPYGFFNIIDDYQKPVGKLKKDDSFSKLKNKCPDDDQTEGTKKILNHSISKMETN